jgi:hypothetical protein
MADTPCVFREAPDADVAHFLMADFSLFVLLVKA